MKRSTILIQLVWSLWMIIILGPIQSEAQDLSFDQYMKAPTYLNPALTGVMNGNFRISTVYHNQWSGQLNSGINGFLLGGDVRFERASRDSQIDFWGVGISFLNDEYNAYNLATKTLSLNTSYHKMLDAKTKQYIGLGFQMGINQLNLNYENLNFEDEFNNVDGYTNTSKEYLPKNNSGYLDFSTGMFYSGNLSEKVHANLGVSYFHITRPNISFYKDVRNPVSSLVQERRLFSKLNIHTAAAISLTELLDIIPDFMYQSQGPHQDFTLGTRLRLALNFEEIENSITIGFRGKVAKNHDGTALSALTFLTDYKQKSLLFGFSYNVMLKPLIIDQLSMNIFEFSLTYTGQYSTDEYHCPEF